jgi:hypothetical protein
MRKLSTGDDSTLGSYRKLTSIVLGEDSAAVRFLDNKISQSPRGEYEEVLADESQMLLMLFSLK